MDTTSIQHFFESWELFQPAVIGSVVAGALLGLIGVYVVLRRVVFLTATISQAAGLGVAGAFYAQIHWAIPASVASPILGSSVTTLALVGVLAYSWAKGGMQPRVDSLLGYGFIVGTAGTLALGTRIVQEVHDIETLLFGSAVAVLPEGLARLLWISVPLLVLHLWFWNGFVSTSFDREGAAIRGVPVRLLDALFFGTLALAISVSTQVLGVLPTFAFSVLPAMAAVGLAPNTQVALLLGAGIGAASGFVGYLAAFLYQLPVGASQSLIAALIVFTVQALSTLKHLAAARQQPTHV